MGFKDVEIDGLSIDSLNEAIDKCNKLFFGSVGIALLDNRRTKGQLELYENAKNSFIEWQFDLFKKYFTDLKWDITDITARANSKQYVKFDWKNKNKWLIFNNGKAEKSYYISTTSDFQDNPHYKLMDDKGWNKISPKGGLPKDATVIKQRLTDIENVLEHNKKLNGNYSFKLSVNKERESGDTNYIPYNSIEELLSEISDEF